MAQKINRKIIKKKKSKIMIVTKQKTKSITLKV